MGWQDAPLVASGAANAAWKSAPVVGAPATVAPLDRLPPENPPGNQTSKNADDIAHRLLGIGEAGLSVASSIPAGIAGQVYGVGKSLASGKFGTPQGVEQGEKAGVDLANLLTYKPRTQTGRDLVESAGNAMDSSRLAGMPVEGPMLARIPEVPRSVLATGEGATGAARSAARGVGNATGRAVASALPDVDPQTVQLARQAHSMGFRLTPDMVYGNKYARGAGELAQDNPLVGKTVREQNQQVFNSHLVKAIGGEGEKLTRKVFAGAMDRSGKTIGDIAASKTVPFDESLVGKLAGHVEAAQKYETGDVEKVVTNVVNEITDKAKGGQLSGEAFRKINTNLNTRIRNTQNGDLKTALSGLQDDLQEQFVSQLNAEELARYNTARRQYAVGKTLEPLVAKSPTGNIAPAALLGAVTRNQAGRSAMARGAAGDLGTLADIGQRFLKEQPSSGTAERGLLQNLMTHPVGTLAAGGTAALTAPFARAYNQLGPDVTQRLLDRPPQ